MDSSFIAHVHIKSPSRQSDFKGNLRTESEHERLRRRNHIHLHTYGDTNIKSTRYPGLSFHNSGLSRNKLGLLVNKPALYYGW